MNPDRVEASLLAAFLRNRNVDATTAADGAIPVAGGFALYIAGTHFQRAFGAGTTRALRDDDLAAVEEFYGARAHPARFELDETVLARDGSLLRSRGYEDDGPELVMLEGPVTGAAQPQTGRVAVRPTTDRRKWAALAARAFADTETEPDVLRRTMEIDAVAAHVLMIATVDGAHAGAAAMSTDGDVALLFSGAVLPEFRGQGVHAALVAGRLAVAHARGAKRASVKTRPGSPVERSTARFGFERIGTRRRLRREPA